MNDDNRVIVVEAGTATAYGSAVEGGYTGTYEDFCRQQAQYAQNASAVEQAKQDAQTARNQAQTAKDDAVTAKNTAVSAKDDAVSAKNTAVSAKDDAVLAKNTASTKAQEASASATSAGLSATSASQSAQNAEQSAQGISGSLAQIATNKADISQIKADLNVLSETISGNVATFYGNEKPLEFKAFIDLEQSGTGTPTATNIRTIVGKTKIDISQSDADTDNPTVTEISLGTTVYKGLYQSDGTLKSEYAMVEYDGTESWAMHGTKVGWFYLIDNTYANGALDASKADFAVCNQSKQVSANNANVMPSGTFIIGDVGANKRIVVYDTSFTTLSAFISHLSDHPLQVCYKLATTAETSIGATSLTALDGINNVWCDTGSIIVTNKIEAKTYIDAKTAPIYDVVLFGQDDFEQGTIDANGYPASNNYRIRFKNYYRATMNFYVANADGYDVNLFKYSDNGTLISTTGFAGDGEIHKYLVSKGDRIKIALGKYPVALTSTSDYAGLNVVDVNNFDKFAVEIDTLGADVTAQTNARIASVKDSANFSKSENLTFYSHAYYVGADKEYTTINQALTAWANDNYPPAVVYISNGEYKETVFVEDHTIAFIGESRDGVVVRTTQGNYTYPPFKIHHGNVLVANLTAIADHSEKPDFAYNQSATMAYAFHIDGGNVGGLVHIKNCKAVSFQSPSFGMGTIPDSTIRLENVEAYSFTASGAGESLNSGNILCHLASPTTYPNVGTETLELINVKAYAENTKRAVFLSQGNSTNTLNIKAISVITASGISDAQDELVVLPTYYDIDALSSGNTCETINHVQ